MLDGVDGVRSINFDVEKQHMIVESNLPVADLQSLIESTGKQAIVKGVGSKPSTSAVAVLGYPVGYATGSVRGVVRFTEIEQQACIVDGTIDGLQPGLHGIHIYSKGDLSQGCDSIGEHYNPYNSPHGGPQDDILNRVGRTDFLIIQRRVNYQMNCESAAFR